MLSCLPPLPPLLLSEGRGLPHEGLSLAASHLLHSLREAKPVSCTPLLIPLRCFPLHTHPLGIFFFFSFCFALSCSLLPGGKNQSKMMQEVSIMVAYDAHVVDRPGEEDTLACLVAHSRPLRSLRPVVGLFIRLVLFFSFAWLDLIVAGLILFSSSVQPLIICCCLTLMADAANLCQ